jgi:hypothetical protein
LIGNEFVAADLLEFVAQDLLEKRGKSISVRSALLDCQHPARPRLQLRRCGQKFQMEDPRILELCSGDNIFGTGANFLAQVRFFRGFSKN